MVYSFHNGYQSPTLPQANQGENEKANEDGEEGDFDHP
jgi:hypothetical protein